MPEGVPPVRVRAARHWATALALLAFVAAHVVSLSSTGVPYVAPLSFLITCWIAWSFGFRAALAWLAFFHAAVPGILTALGVGMLVAFPDIRGFLLLLMASSIAAQVALAYLTTRTRSLTEQLRDSRGALLATNEELQRALDEVKELRGFLPICAWCKDIRDVSGNWEKIESYLARHSRAVFTHGLCPKCSEEIKAG